MTICIICRKPFSNTIESSTEHIIPEFLGGSLVFDTVCKSCNSKMGGDFEGRLSNMWLFNTSAFIHDIKGKSGDNDHPLQGFHKLLNDQGNILIDKKGNQRLQFNSPINISCCGDNPLKVNMQIRGDADNLKQLKDDACKKVIRYAKKNKIAISDEEILVIVKTEFEKSINTARINTLSNISIPRNFSIDISDMELLYIKIAYELAVYHFGLEYINDSVAKNLALSLYNLKVESAVDVSVLQETEEPFNTIFEDGYHWVYFSGKFCFIKIYDFFGRVCFSQKEYSSHDQKDIYKFSYKNKTLQEKLHWLDLLLNAFNAGRIKNLEDYCIRYTIPINK